MKAISCIPIFMGKDLQLIQKAVTDLLFYQYLVLKRLTILCIIVFKLIISPPPKCMHMSPFHFRKSEINPFIYIPKVPAIEEKIAPTAKSMSRHL